MKRITVLLLVISLFAFNKDKKAYLIYNSDANTSSYQELLASASKADIVLFGELHNNPIAHWLQLELSKDLLEESKGKLIMGAEMYEADDQLIINEYLNDRHSYKTLKNEAKLWPNDETDYNPLLELAKENNIPFIASNIPRRYANMVYRGGYEILDSLDKEALSYIAPIPFPYPDSINAYSSMLAMAQGHGGDNLPKSQAIKDATMAHFILKNFKKGHTFIHFEGAYHSDNHESIAWYLKYWNPKLKIMTISSVEQENIEKLDSANTGIADYIIAIPENMTKTY